MSRPVVAQAEWELAFWTWGALATSVTVQLHVLDCRRGFLSLIALSHLVSLHDKLVCRVERPVAVSNG